MKSKNKKKKKEKPKFWYKNKLWYQKSLDEAIHDGTFAILFEGLHAKLHKGEKL